MLSQKKAPSALTWLFASALVIIAFVQVILFGMWFVQTGLPLVLTHVGDWSSEQIFLHNDPYREVRAFLRERLRRGDSLDSIVLVADQVSPPTRFDLEVYYELYPVLPKKVAIGSEELASAVRVAKTGTAFIVNGEATELATRSEQFEVRQGAGYLIYIAR